MATIVRRLIRPHRPGEVALLFIGCSDSTASSTGSDANASCLVRPELTEGTPPLLRSPWTTLDLETVSQIVGLICSLPVTDPGPSNEGCPRVGLGAPSRSFDRVHPLADLLRARASACSSYPLFCCCRDQRRIPSPWKRPWRVPRLEGRWLPGPPG